MNKKKKSKPIYWARSPIKKSTGIRSCRAAGGGQDKARRYIKEPSIKRLLSVNELSRREPALVEEYVAKYSR